MCTYRLTGPAFAASASLQDVRRLGSEILERYSNVRVLINNAGAMYSSRQLSPDGIELTWAVNHLAPFLLTNLLLENLKASAPARIITTSSGAHYGAQIPFDDLNAERGYGNMGYRRYGETKLANILFTAELARRLEGSGVTANCFHPGFVNTGFNANNGSLMRVGMWLAHRTAGSGPSRLASPRESGEQWVTMKMLVTAAAVFQRDPTRFAELERQHGIEILVPERGAATTPLIGDVDAVYGQLTADEFPSAANLKWVQSPSAGVEWMWRVPGLQESDIVVTNMRGAHAATIAEHTFAMLLAHTRGLRAFEDLQREHQWGRGELALSAIKGLTMGIVGFGNIGRAIARRATGFEMRVLAVDTESVPPGEGVEEVWSLDRLTDLCRESDVLAMAAPITPNSRDMIGREHIRNMKRGSYILQMSRGGIVNESALVDALEEGHLAGAGLDVTATEPLPVGDPLWTAPNLIITPHTSAASQLTFDLVWSILSENVGRFVRGEPLLNTVDKRRGW